MWGDILKGSPVYMSSAEIYMALKTGLIDAVHQSAETFVGRKAHEEAGHCCDLKLHFVAGSTGVNSDVWNGLPADTRQIIEEEYINWAVDWVNKEMIAADEEAFDTIVEAGWTRHIPTPEEREAWATALAPMKDWYIEQAGPVAEKLLAEAAKYWK